MSYVPGSSLPNMKPPRWSVYAKRGFGRVGDLRTNCAPPTPARDVESRTTPAKAASFLPVESRVTESCEKTGIPIMGPEVTRDITHPGAENETAIANSVLLKRATIDDFTRPTKDVSLSNAPVPLRAILL
jgi:hypothetical protein